MTIPISINFTLRYKIPLRFGTSFNLFIFAGGLLAILIAFMVLYMAGVNQWICIALGIISASVLVWATFHLNAKYGEWGLMKIQAAKNHPRYIINRKRFLRLIIPNLKNRKS